MIPDPASFLAGLTVGGIAGLFAGRWPIRNIRTWRRFRLGQHTWVEIPPELDEQQERTP